MSQEPNLYEMHEKIGKILAGLDELNKKFNRLEEEQGKRHDENVKRFSDTFEKLREFKHEQCGNEQKLSCEMYRIRKDVSELRKPVNEIIALRSKVGLFMAAMLSIGGGIWFFLQPIWTFFSERLIGHVIDGGGNH